MAVRNVDVSTFVSYNVCVSIDIEVSPTLDGMGTIGDWEYEISNNSNTGHDMSF